MKNPKQKAIAITIMCALSLASLSCGAAVAVGNQDRGENVEQRKNNPGALVTIEEWDGVAASALEMIFEDDHHRYYLTSVRSDKIMLTFDNGERISLREAISRGAITIEDLILSGLNVYVETVL